MTQPPSRLLKQHRLPSLRTPSQALSRPPLPRIRYVSASCCSLSLLQPCFTHPLSLLIQAAEPPSITQDKVMPGFVPPALWLCPMRGGVPFRDIPEFLASEPKYAKYIDWVHSPPNFPAISLNGSDQRCTPPITTALGNRVVLSGAQEVNDDFSMRMYVDDADKSNAIVKISPHVSVNSLCPLPLPRLCPPQTNSSRSSFKSSAKAPTKINEETPRHCATPLTRCRAAWASPTTCASLRIIQKRHLSSACSHLMSRVVSCWARAPFAATYYSTSSGGQQCL